ncbi:hypothetical protein CsSME_00001660 [Camellia sinensis var. sinensis]
MATLSSQFHITSHSTYQNVRSRPSISCSMQPPQNNIKIVINGAAKEIGMAAVVAVTKARGMEVAGAVDSYFVGEDIGKVCDMEEPLEIPIMNDLTMVLGSISQLKETAVVVDFTDPSTVYDNVKQVSCLDQHYNQIALHIQAMTFRNDTMCMVHFFPLFVFPIGNSIWHEKCCLCASH